jgi:hypothetical protein
LDVTGTVSKKSSYYDVMSHLLIQHSVGGSVFLHTLFIVPHLSSHSVLKENLFGYEKQHHFVGSLLDMPIDFYTNNSQFLENCRVNVLLSLHFLFFSFNERRMCRTL